MDKKRVLFVRVHNSARSQMTEAFLKKYGEDRLEVESAGEIKAPRYRKGSSVHALRYHIVQESPDIFQ